MYVAFNELPKSARIWIYQSIGALNKEELDYVSERAVEFCSQWSAHGYQLKSSFQIYYNRFLVLAVDESTEMPSGCSIDSSVHFVRQIESQLKVDLFDRSNVAFIIDNELYFEPITSIKTKVEQGEITSDTITLNNLVPDIQGLESGWKVPAGNTWLKKYFRQ